jgi:hypothetical protein
MYNLQEIYVTGPAAAQGDEEVFRSTAIVRTNEA